MAKAKAPRKPPTPRPIRKSLIASLARFRTRAVEEGDDAVEEILNQAGTALANMDKQERAAELRREADALDGGLDG